MGVSHHLPKPPTYVKGEKIQLKLADWNPDMEIRFCCFVSYFPEKVEKQLVLLQNVTTATL